MYLSAPLPFVGQKRMFVREFIKVLKQFPDDATFIDLFGGSGLLSHIAKRCKPNATVVYNDFDNYRRRLENIPRTNRSPIFEKSWAIPFLGTRRSPETFGSAYSTAFSGRSAKPDTWISSRSLPRLCFR